MTNEQNNLTYLKEIAKSVSAETEGASNLYTDYLKIIAETLSSGLPSSEGGASSEEIEALRAADTDILKRIAAMEASGGNGAGSGEPDLSTVLLPSAYKNNVWSGKKLGGSITSEQLNSIRTGTFDGLGLGDYWDFMDGQFRIYIVDFDYFQNTVFNETNPHHLVVMPVGGNATTGRYNGDEGLGYYFSNIRKDLATLETQIAEAGLELHTVKVWQQVVRTCDENGVATSCDSIESSSGMASVKMLTGENIVANNDLANPYANYGASRQFSALRLSRDFFREVCAITSAGHSKFATRDPASAATLYCVDQYGGLNGTTTMDDSGRSGAKMLYYLYYLTIG